MPFRCLSGPARLSVICREAILRIIHLSHDSKSLPKIETCPHLGHKGQNQGSFHGDRGTTFEGCPPLFKVRGWGSRGPPARSLDFAPCTPSRQSLHPTHDCPNQGRAADFAPRIPGQKRMALPVAPGGAWFW